MYTQLCTALEAGFDQHQSISPRLQQDAAPLNWDFYSQAFPPWGQWPDLTAKQFSEINKSERELQNSPPETGNFLGVREHAQTRFIFSSHPFITGEAARAAGGGGKLFTGFFLSTPPHNRHNNYSSNIINTFLFFHSVTTCRVRYQPLQLEEVLG